MISLSSKKAPYRFILVEGFRMLPHLDSNQKPADSQPEALPPAAIVIELPVRRERKKTAA